MKALIRPSASLLLFFTLLTGFAYPALVTGVAQLVFPSQANGSLVRVHGRVIGSSLLGTCFDDPAYFWGRPSATSPACNAAASAGSNLGPSNPALVDGVRARVAALRAADPGNHAPVPVDLVTASASGLDPDVSPAGALYQVRRVARARRLPEERIRALVLAHVDGPTLGILGESRVNVLELDLALDRLAGPPPAAP